jgi:hypothetical protein
MKVRKTAEWLSARAGDEILMMSAANGTYLGLDRMGARIWELLDAIDDSEELCKTLLAEFTVSKQVCDEEVAAFLAELERHKALEVLAR